LLHELLHLGLQAHQQAAGAVNILRVLFLQAPQLLLCACKLLPQLLLNFMLLLLLLLLLLLAAALAIGWLRLLLQLMLQHVNLWQEQQAHVQVFLVTLLLQHRHSYVKAPHRMHAHVSQHTID
jgi:hypothetical protein